MSNFPSPCFIMQSHKLAKNLALFASIKHKNIKWLYTIKCFHEQEALIQIAQTFDGFSIGNLTELSKIPINNVQHIHTYSPAFYPHEVLSLAKASDSISFNSLTQWQSYAKETSAYTSIGLRINPKLKIKQPSYCDSSHENSRFGVDYRKFIKCYEENSQDFNTLDGLHFHVFCHQGLEEFQALLTHIQTHYKNILPKLKWLNLGGGQSFTENHYDIQGFIHAIKTFSHLYPHLTLYFEPASAVVNDTGYFSCTILDIIEDKIPKVILDTSIETHLLDVSISKRKLQIIESTKKGLQYEITGMSCIAGDTFGTYHFPKKLQIGDRLRFSNMIGYTLVKQTEFNGIGKAGFIIM